MGIMTTEILEKESKLKNVTKKAFSSSNIIPNNREMQISDIDDFLEKHEYVKKTKKNKKEENENLEAEKKEAF